MPYTTSIAFFEAIWEAGITHCFVNLGSDHPGIIEAILLGQRERPDAFPRIITCPSEMVAVSMADGYARVTNKPALVLLHTDVGTQAAGCSLHNASAGRAPVLIFAGLSPCTSEGEYPGSRTEWIHWIQDVPDQKQIVAQYCRYVGEIKRAKNVKQMINRALSFACSNPKGPVYLCAAREVLEEEISPYALNQDYWQPTEPGALSLSQVKRLSEALAEAKQPLLITGYSGRNHRAPDALVELANTVRGLRVLDTGGSDMCFPANHPAWLGFRYGIEEHIKTADVILVLDCDVPWVPTQCRPMKGAKIFHIDQDVLKRQMPVFYINAIARYSADSEVAISQVAEYFKTHMKDEISSQIYSERWTLLKEEHQARLEKIAEQALPDDNGALSTGYLTKRLRESCPADTIWAVEAVTNCAIVSDQLQCVTPGSWVHCGGGGLGWSGGGAMGVKLGSDEQAGGPGKGKFVCQIVGDGCYLFSFPSSVYWIAQRYNIPVLTVVLNNKGWNAPRKSLLLVHPEGEGSKVSNEDINISFAPSPDYAGIAKAAAGGRCWAGTAGSIAELDQILADAIASVKGGTSAVLDAHIGGSEGKFTSQEVE